MAKNKHDRKNSKIVTPAKEIPLPEGIKEVSGTLKLPDHVESGLSIYFGKRDPKDIDLVYMVAENLKLNIGAYAAEIFRNRPEIKAIAELSSVAQRVIINRYFKFLLMQYRAHSNIPTLSYAQALVNDGTIDDWFRLFNTYVTPFLSDNNVYKTLYKLSGEKND